MKGLLIRYREQVHPCLNTDEENDLTMRLNVLASLDPTRFHKASPGFCGMRMIFCNGSGSFIVVIPAGIIHTMTQVLRSSRL